MKLSYKIYEIRNAKKQELESENISSEDEMQVIEFHLKTTKNSNNNSLKLSNWLKFSNNI